VPYVRDSPDDPDLVIADALGFEIGEVATFEHRRNFRLLDFPETFSFGS